jgi:hypothetical protein
MRKIVIKRGENPILRFRAPFDDDNEAEITAYFYQDGKKVLEKDCVNDGDEVYISLSESDTLKLKGDRCAEIEFKITKDDNIYISDVATAEICGESEAET